MRPVSVGRIPWWEDANAARPDSAAAATRISHGVSERRMAAQGRDAERQDRPPGVREEFGLTHDQIYDAIDAGTLQYRQAYMHGNPWLRLLRREVKALARARHGDRYVNEQQARAELTRVNREIRRLRTELAELEERRAKLGSDPGE
jgi:chromosome segregation ATPase